MLPKRIIHGEGIWGSDKLARVEPTWARPEYANLIPLALANGVFEVNPKKIWSSVYAYNRPEITVEKVEEILAAFVKAGLLFIWCDATTGKQWGFWVGIDKAGRLPAASRLKRGHDSVGPIPPVDALQEYTNQPMASHRLTNGLVGSGSGSGSGNTISSEAIASDEQVSKPTARKEPSPEGIELANLLRTGIIGNNPDAKITESQVREWGREADRMMRRDSRTPAAIRELIEFSQADPFWLQNILSMGTLREKFDQLTVKRKGSAKQGPVSAPPVLMPKRRSELDDAGRAEYARHGVNL